MTDISDCNTESTQQGARKYQHIIIFPILPFLNVNLVALSTFTMSNYHRLTFHHPKLKSCICEAITPHVLLPHPLVTSFSR